MNQHDDLPTDDEAGAASADDATSTSIAVDDPVMDGDEPFDSGDAPGHDDPPGDGDPPGGPGAPPPNQPGPPPGHAVGDTGLVRDPYAFFGGVLSGIAHRYAWSVAIVRLVFIALLLVSGGAAFLLYLAAWVIVPRASHWPPVVVRRRGERLNNRDIGLAVAAVGLVAFFATSTDGAAAVLVPLALVGAGIWLLLQHQRGPADAPGVAPPPGPAVPSFATPPPPVGQPVAPRRRRRWLILLIVIPLLLMLLAVVGAIAALVSGGADGFNLTIGDDRLVIANYRPDTLDDLPSSIAGDVGGVRIDLTDVPLAEFEQLDEPFELDIRLDNGAVDLELPDDLAVSIDARVGDGDIDTSDARLVGADIGSRTLELDDPNADLIIDIDVDNGNIEISTDR